MPAKLVRSLGLSYGSEPEAVQVPERKRSGYTLPRSSGQGGRRLWVAHQRGTEFDLSIEMDGTFQRFLFKQSLPTGKGTSAVAKQDGTRPMSYMTDESAQNGMVWDLGTYEVVEGSLAKTAVDLYLSGRKLEGQWRFTRTGKQWQVTNGGGKLKRDLPLDASALPGQNADEDGSSARRKPAVQINAETTPIAFTEPMECKPVEQLPEGDDWAYEVKLDGYRVQAIRDAKHSSFALAQGQATDSGVPGSCCGPAYTAARNRRGWGDCCAR